MNRKLLDFDTCSEENKAKGGAKGNRKASSDKMASESIPPGSNTSKEIHMRKERSYQKIWASGPRWGIGYAKALKCSQLGCYVCAFVLFAPLLVS